MGQSLSQLYVHLVFGTKNRLPMIKGTYQKRLHSYIASTLKEYDSTSLIVNSTEDHIHILFRLSKNHSLARIVEEVKKQSSRWIKEIDNKNPKFSWQAGYGAFSVSSAKINIVKRYIIDQEKHHKVKTYKEEIEEFLKAYDINDYDVKYFWR